MRPGGRFVANAVTVKFLLEEAYGVKDTQVSGAPPWLGTERFDIDAKPDEATAVAIDKMPPEQRRQQLMLMLQSLLADRFKLSITLEQKELPVYALVVGKGGPKFHESTFKPPENLTRYSASAWHGRTGTDGNHDERPRRNDSDIRRYADVR